MGKVLYLVAGANGSGKSTISTVLLPQKGLVFVNPDDIAREMSPKNPPGVRIEAGRAALARMNDLLSSCRSFAVESTLSGRAHLSLIARARALGYCIILIYSFVDSVDACIARIAMRVQAGGHFVPDEDVRRRYLRSKRNFLNVYSPVADEWMLYYNGDSVPVLVAHGGRLDETHVVSPRLMDRFKEDLCPVM
ncbi:MAG: AAA family ATPase [bacterium]|nr:AAA family ATPase [bacterium]MDO5311993.1 AAA family ATPase [bacterium]